MTTIASIILYSHQYFSNLEYILPTIDDTKALEDCIAFQCLLIYE